MIKASYSERIVRKTKDLRPYLFKAMTARLPAFFCGKKQSIFIIKKSISERNKPKCQNVQSLSYYYYLP